MAPGIDCYQNCPFSFGPAVVVALLVGVVTAPIGALIGLAFETERSVGVQAGKPKVALTLTPGKGQMRVGLSVSF